MKKLIADSRLKLAATYLAIIMTMCVGFSFVIFNTSARELDRPSPRDSLEFLRESQEDGPRNVPQGVSRRAQFDSYLSSRNDQAKKALISKLILLNLSALLAGSWFSYYLARKTLTPIHKAMEAQVRFVSDASHELRTPLTAIQTTNEVALRRKVLTEKDARELLKENVSEVEKLKNLSDSLLSLIKTDSTISKSLSKVKLLDCVDESLKSINPTAEKKQIKIINQCKAANVMADHDSLVRILTILFDNAIKYSEANSTVTVSSRINQTRLSLSVQDHGEGISIQDQAHIFDRFYRADESRNKTSTIGFGLGLAIAKDLAQRQNASLTVKSKPGQGSTFTVSLKLA